MKTTVSVRLTPERLAQADAVARKLGTTRSGAIDAALRILPDLLDGKAELKFGPFAVVEIQLGPYGEALSRKRLAEPFQSRQEASEGAVEAAAAYAGPHGAHGRNDKQGYWWGRTADGKVSKFFVEVK